MVANNSLSKMKHWIRIFVPLPKHSYTEVMWSKKTWNLLWWILLKLFLTRSLQLSARWYGKTVFAFRFRVALSSGLTLAQKLAGLIKWLVWQCCWHVILHLLWITSGQHRVLFKVIFQWKIIWVHLMDYSVCSVLKRPIERMIIYKV